MRTLGCADVAGTCNTEVLGVGRLLVIAGTPLIALVGLAVPA